MSYIFKKGVIMENDGLGKGKIRNKLFTALDRSISEEAIGSLISKLNISCCAGFRATICPTDFGKKI